MMFERCPYYECVAMSDLFLLSHLSVNVPAETLQMGGND
jgi:hypothetical protein